MGISEKYSNSWTTPTKACIQRHNNEIVPAVPSITECQQLCEKASSNYSCLSIEYEMSFKTCYLSTKRKVTAGADYFRPCNNHADQTLYTERIPGENVNEEFVLDLTACKSDVEIRITNICTAVP
jgi:hypothetical protein